MITLTNGTTTLELDEDLYWDDEFAWSATEQSVERSLTGAQIIHLGLRQAGRPITLRTEDESSGWMTRADMVALQAWANTPGLQLTLSLRGTDYSVLFRHHDGGAFEARPVVHYADPDPSDWVVPTLRFITV
jgi:hypothetical protein